MIVSDWIQHMLLPFCTWHNMPFENLFFVFYNLQYALSMIMSDAVKKTENFGDIKDTKHRH